MLVVSPSHCLQAEPSALYLPEPHAEQPMRALLGPVTPEPAGHVAHTRFCVVVVEQACVW